VSETPLVSLVCCDLVGAVATDGSALERAFAEAIATQGIVVGTKAYVRAMVTFDRALGWPPPDIMHTLFPDEPIRAQAANLAFERSFSAAVDRFGLTPVPGAVDALTKLAAGGTKICLLTCFSRRSSSLLLERMRWCQQADLVLCADDVERGYPWPDALLTAVLRLGTGDVRSLAVITASESGVLAAQRAGAGVIVGMHTGVHDAGRLHRAGATALLSDLTELSDALAATYTGQTVIDA
jgi:phosphoglycolate phosphatase